MHHIMMLLFLSKPAKNGERPYNLQCIAEASADNFCSVFNSSSVVIPDNTHITFSDFLNVPSISGRDVTQAIRHLNALKCIGPDEIPSFIINGCSEMSTPYLCNMLNIIF
jgi:hypothetical protein